MQLSASYDVDYGMVEWTLTVQTGHIRDYSIIASDRMKNLFVGKRHAH